MTATWSEERITLQNGLTLALKRRAGSEQGRVVLALHGWLDNSETFNPLAAELPEAEWLCVDLAGHGRSDHRAADGAYHTIEWLHDLDLLLGHLATRHGPIHIIGHSLGAALACLLTAARPELVQSVVAIDGLGGTPEVPSQRLRRLKQHLDDRMVALKRDRIPRYPSVEYMVSLRQRAAPLPESIAAQVVARNAKANSDGTWTWSSDPKVRMATAFRLTEDYYQSLAKDLVTPTLAILFHKTGVLLFPAQAKRAALLPRARIKMLEAEHHGHATEPQKIAAWIRDFWTQPPAFNPLPDQSVVENPQA